VETFKFRRFIHGIFVMKVDRAI